MRLVLIGDRLPALQARRVEASALRTRQLLEPLLDAGHEVVLVTPCGTDGEVDDRAASGACSQHEIDFRRPAWMSQLNHLCDRTRPDGVIGVMWRGGLRATRVRHRPPLWIDLYGDLLAENQVSAYSRRTDAGGASAPWVESVLLRAGDVFSTCSRRQKYATIGRLGLLGRLNSTTCGYQFVHAIPAGLVTPAPQRASCIPHDTRLLEDDSGHTQQLPANAVVLLWSGGYNVWMDLDALVGGLEYAMARNQDLHYVSTGAGVVNPDVYQRFRDRVRRSVHANRFHLLGWQPTEVVESLHRRADIGIVVDGTHYETELGTRTRLISMAAAGMALVSTEGCELVDDLRRAGAIRTYPSGDSDALGRAIVELAESSSRRAELGDRARSTVDELYNAQATVMPLLQWAASPWRAPDAAAGKSTVRWLNRLRLLGRQAAWRFAGNSR